MQALGDWGVQHPRRAATATGVLVGIALSYPWLWPIGIAALAFGLQLFGTAISWHAALARGWWFGFGKSIVVLSWLAAVYPLDWLGLPVGRYQYLLIALYWIPAAAVLALASVLVALYLYKSVQRQLRWVAVLGVPVAWVLGEVFAAFIFSFLMLGPGSTLNASFSFGQVGYLLASHDLLVQLSIWGGVHLLSAVVVAWAIIVWRGYARAPRLVVGGSIALVIVGMLPFSLPIATPTESQTIAVIETWYPASRDEAHNVAQRAALPDALQTAARYRPTYVVLPEDAQLTHYFGSPTSTLAWLSSVYRAPAIIIDSATTDVAGQIVLRAYLYDTANYEVFTIDKSYFVPQGEYVPYIYRQLIKLLPLPDTVRATLLSTQYTTLHTAIQPQPKQSLPGVLFCFESIMPFRATQLVSEDPELPFIAHIASYGWFPSTPHTLHNQVDTMLRVRATQAQVPIVQVANRGPITTWGTFATPLTPELETASWRLHIGQF